MTPVDELSEWVVLIGGPEDVDLWGVYTTEEAATAEVDKQVAEGFDRELFTIQRHDLEGEPPRA